MVPPLLKGTRGWHSSSMIVYRQVPSPYYTPTEWCSLHRCVNCTASDLSLDGHEVAEQRAHDGRELGLVEEVASLADGLGSGRVRVDDARETTEADLALHRDGHLAENIEERPVGQEHCCQTTVSTCARFSIKTAVGIHMPRDQDERVGIAAKRCMTMFLIPLLLRRAA